MKANEALLQGLIDYAGLYPPALLDMSTAVRNYLAYSGGERGPMLGRFIVDLARLNELQQAAGDALQSMRLSVIVPPVTDFDALRVAAAKLPIDSVEIKCGEPLTIARICDRLPAGVERYFEINVSSTCTSAIDSLASVDARAKLRMGGVVADAFPASTIVARALHTLADRRVPFKATAGLHHPIRSVHRLTYAPDAPRGTMHGFINLFCSAATVYSGEGTEAAERILDEQDAHAFELSGETIEWRDLRWDAYQVHTVRQHFFTSYGSCSFTEPVQDLEALGWL